MTKCKVIISNRKIRCRITIPIKVRVFEHMCIPPDTPQLITQDAIEEYIMCLFGGDWVLVTWGYCGGESNGRHS